MHPPLTKIDHPIMQSEKYMKFIAWIKESKPETKPFTRMQVEFIEFLLTHKDEVNKIGDVLTSFKLVTKYFKGS